MEFGLCEFETIGDEYRSRLEQIGITSLESYLKIPDEEIEAKTGIEPRLIRNWRSILELFLVPTISAREAELLVKSNIDCIEELSHRQAVRIYYKFKEIHETSYVIILDIPTFQRINVWIYYAKLMTKRLKNCINEPLTMLPMVSVANAIEAKKYQAVTVAELLIKEKVIKKFWKKMKMSKAEYDTMMDFISILKIRGVDMHVAKILWVAGVKSDEQMLSLPDEEIVGMVKASIGDNDEVTAESVAAWKKQLEEIKLEREQAEQEGN